jgi:phthalate 4,5-cis-dihydrodiol dehydrogenase
MAGGGMIPAIDASPHFELAAAADARASLRDRFRAHRNLPVFASERELFADGGIDAVYVATPHQMHEDHVRQAAAAGKHVIVEKPMALSSAACDAMIGAVERAGVTMVVGHSHGFDPAVRAMHEAIASGAYGRPAMINTFSYTDFIYRPRRPEELQTEKGGGIIFNQLPHQIEILRLLAGSTVKSVRAAGYVLDPARPTEGCLTAFVRFGNGAAASMTYSGYDRFDVDEFHDWVSESGLPKTARHGATQQRQAQFAEAAEEIAARSDHYGYGSDRQQARERASGARQPHFGSLIVTCEKADLRQTPDGYAVYDRSGCREVRLPPDAYSGRLQVLEELYLAIAGIKPAVHDGRFGRDTLRVALALLQSVRADREIEIAEIEP